MKTLMKSAMTWLFAVLMTFGLASAAFGQTTANWIGPASGGEWNTGANWDTGFPPLDATTNAFIGAGSNVNYSLPMAATSFGSLTLQGVLNINTNNFNSGLILLNKPGGGAKVLMNTGAVVSVTGNFGIQSNANLTMSAGTSLTISGNLNIGSDPAGGSGGTSTAGNYGNVTNNGGNIVVSGSTTFNPKNVSLSTGTHALMVVNGGTNNLGAVDIHRSGGTSQAALGVEGLVVSNGFVNMTSFRVGDNSFGSMFIANGVVTNSGAGTLRNGTANRPARIIQNSGYFVCEGTNMLTVSTGAGNGVTYAILGGTNYAAGFQIGDPAVLTSVGTANFTNQASIFVGSGGMASNGAAVVNISLNTGGRFAASADWTNTVPITLNGGIIDAEDETGAPHTIYSSGIFRGAGSLIKTGPGTLILAGTNINSGATLINNGTLALSTDVSGTEGTIASASIIVGSGSTFDVSQEPGFAVNALQTLGGFGTVTGTVTVAPAGIINAGSNTVTGTLTFNNDVIETNGAINHFDVPGDVINILGSFTVSGSNVMEIAGSLTPGTPYALVHYGSFSGDVSSFGVSGATGTLSNSVTDKTIYLTLSSILRGNTNLTWIGNSTNEVWDTHASTNWLQGGVGPLDFFLSGDIARFDNTAGANTNVNIPGIVSPASVTVDSTLSYAFSGNGVISGPSTTMTKTNSGTLTILTTNAYAGATILGGGAIEIFSITNGGIPSPLGAATSDPSFVAFNGGTLRYSGESAGTDHGATFNTNAIIDVTNSATTLTLNGTMVGSGGLTKVGSGSLSLTANNSYTGVTTISNGVLVANGVSTISPNTINYAGGTLNLASASVQQFYANLNNVISNSTIVQNGGNANLILSGGWSGAGTMNIDIQNSGGTLTLNHDLTTNFTGTIHLTDASTGGFRFNSGGSATAAQQCTGSPLVTFDLGNGSATLFNRNGGGTTNGYYYLGALTGGPSTILKGNGTGSTPSINSSFYVIGAKNLDTTFAGTIADGNTATAIIKVGTGKLTLTGSSSYSGSTVVSNGVLALGDGTTDGSIVNTTNIDIEASAILDISKLSSGTLFLGGNQTLQGNGTLYGTLSASGIVAPGGGMSDGTGTLTVTNSVSLLATTWMKLNRTAAQTSDRLVSPAISLGGTLVVTNVGPELQAGDTFTLFSGPLTGSFTTVVLPNYYTWDTNQLAANGIIRVTAFNPPGLHIDFSTLSTGTINLTASNGLPSGTLSVLTTTNISLPVTNWTSVTAGSFDTSGNFSSPITVDPTLPTQFFILSVQ